MLVRMVRTTCNYLTFSSVYLSGAFILAKFVFLASYLRYHPSMQWAQSLRAFRSIIPQKRTFEQHMLLMTQLVESKHTGFASVLRKVEASRWDQALASVVRSEMYPFTLTSIMRVLKSENRWYESMQLLSLCSARHPYCLRESHLQHQTLMLENNSSTQSHLDQTIACLNACYRQGVYPSPTFCGSVVRQCDRYAGTQWVEAMRLISRPGIVYRVVDINRVLARLHRISAWEHALVVVGTCCEPTSGGPLTMNNYTVDIVSAMSRALIHDAPTRHRAIGWIADRFGRLPEQVVEELHLLRLCEVGNWSSALKVLVASTNGHRKAPDMHCVAATLQHLDGPTQWRLALRVWAWTAAFHEKPLHTPPCDAKLGKVVAVLIEKLATQPAIQLSLVNSPYNAVMHTQRLMTRR